MTFNVNSTQTDNPLQAVVIIIVVAVVVVAGLLVYHKKHKHSEKQTVSLTQ
jgi:hypothetical protein